MRGNRQLPESEVLDGGPSQDSASQYSRNGSAASLMPLRYMSILK
jgi:hypothetical protein